MAKEDAFYIVELRDSNSAWVLYKETNTEGRYHNWGPVCSALLVRSIWKQSRNDGCGMLINDRFYHARALDWNFGYGKYALETTHPNDDSTDFWRYRTQLIEQRKQHDRAVH